MIHRLKRLAARTGLHEQLLLIILLLLAGAIWAFIALADEVGEGGTLRFDTLILRAMRSPSDPARPIGPLWVEAMARDITALGGVAVLSLVVAAVAGYLALVRKYAALLLVLIASLGALGLSSALKHFIGRARPTIIPHLQQVYTYSFPSGHSMMSSAVYLTLGSLMARLVEERRAKIYFLLLAILLTFLIGLSRIFLGVHYPTDVLAGWTAGLTWGLLCWLAARTLQTHGAVEKDTDHPVDPSHVP